MTLDLCSHSLDYALDEIHDELLQRRYARHLPTCSACTRDVAEYREILESLQLTDTPATSVPDCAQQRTKRSANIISFPYRQAFKTSRINQKAQHVGRQSASLSISLTLAAMALAVLVHGGHTKSVAAFSDVAFDHVTNTVKIDSSHLRRAFWRI